MKLEAEKNKLDNLLTDNLIRRRDEVLHALQEISLEDCKRQLTNSRAKVEEVDKKIEKVNKELVIMETKVKEMSQKVWETLFKAFQAEPEKWKKAEKGAQDKIDEHLEKYATKQNMLEQIIAGSVEKINQLGALPADDLYNYYVKLSSRVELEKTNNQLKKYRHVNKKAHELF